MNIVRLRKATPVLLAVAAILVAAGNVQAIPLGAQPPYTNGRDLASGGPQWSAVFLYADAADQSDLHELTVAPLAGAPIFNNTVNNPGDTAGPYASFYGQALTFILENISEATQYSTGAASTNVSYFDYSNLPGPAFDTTVETVYEVDFNGAAEAALVALAAANPGTTLILAFEDVVIPESDEDFNDLIFAFAPLIPEPATIGLLAVGSTAFLFRRKRA